MSTVTRKILSAVTAAALILSSMPAVLANEDNVNVSTTDEILTNEAVVETQTDESEEDVSLFADKYPFQDTSLSFEERAADLVSRLTLEEKAAETAAKGTQGIKRLGIEKYDWWNEGIHGVAREGAATSFPSSLAMSNTWDRQLMFDVMDITSTEARGKHPRYNLSYWNPTINMARDPRWGRNEESYGEDPYLTSEIASSAVRGMEGLDEKYIKIISTLKHYAANNCEGERQRGTSVVNERTMREYYLRAFRDIIEDTDPAAVMSSYNGTTIYRNGEILSSSGGQKIDYIASSANEYLLNDMLNRTYGFRGLIVGDCGAWDNTYGQEPIKQKLYPNEKFDDITQAMSVSKVLLAGSSLDCGALGPNFIVEAVKSGLVSEDVLDVALYKAYLQRMKLGEFDDGAKYQDIKPSVIEAEEHIAKAEEAAEESWVLLENNGVLPLAGGDEVISDAPYVITGAEYGSDGKLNVSYEKNAGAPENAQLVAATYSGAGKRTLVSVENVAIDGSGSQSVDIAEPENGATKVFVWEDMTSIKPLSNMKTVGVSGGGPINLAIVGDLADTVVLGDYSADMSQMKKEYLITPLQGIKSELEKTNPGSNVELIGNVKDSTPLFNIKSITLVKSGGKTTTVDLSKATKAMGLTKNGSEFTDITKAAMAVIPQVDFAGVTDVQIEAASLPGMPRVTVDIGYGNSSQPVAHIPISTTSGATDYKVNTATYDGATGGYISKADMYITVSASAEFTVANYKDSLDKADYIIAYGGTTTADSGESNDRKSIDLPATQSHVQQICDEYPEKTIVVLQTVGQVNVEPFKDKCAALLWTSYNGQKQGEALGKVLTGKVNPSGKLSTTWYTVADLDKMPIGSEGETINKIKYNFTNYELSGDINNPTAEYPGRTYQYYKGTPVYPFGYGTSYTTFEYSNIKIDKANADANDKVTITADITNTGDVAGTEVAQLYITVSGADGKNLPLKQLKGFERVTLEAGEKKTVTFTLDISDVFFFDEATQKNYVVNGEYTAMVGGNANDANAQTIKFNVSGTIAESLKNVYVIPSGLKLYIATLGGNKPSVAGNSITANASVTLKDDQMIMSDFAAKGITLSYSSSNEAVAKVDENGAVIAGGTEGTATITVTASKGGESVTTTFPVVAQSKEGISDEDKAKYISQIEDVYKTCPEIAYTPENWQKVQEIYNNIKTFINEQVLEDGVALKVKEAIDAMNAVPKHNLTESFTVQSKNANIVKDGRIEYAEGGIGVITATDATVSGTITADNPAVIEMQALESGSAVTSSLLWTIERLDGSSRKDAEINSETGQITLYENGVYKITANDYVNKKCGIITVLANLQIEAESAESVGTAKVESDKAGTSGGKNLGSTAANWIRFDGVKLERLKDITFRVSQKETESAIKVSLMPNDDWIIATATAPVTGAWDKWAEVKAEVNRNELTKRTLNEGGCATIYVQTNKANLDYLKLGYDYSDIDAFAMTNGRIGVNVSYDSGKLTAKVGGAEKASVDITKAGFYTLSGFNKDDAVTLSVLNAEGQPVGDAVELKYTAPEVKKLTVYNFSDPMFDTFFNSGKGTWLTSGFGMDGYGGWQSDKGGSFSYNGRTYTFTRSLKGGAGEENALRVYFTPDADGVVTAIFNANTERVMYIKQGDKIVEKYGNGSICMMQANVKAGETVYVYGGGSNKLFYGVLFEADKEVQEEKPEPTPEPTATPEPIVLPDTDYVQKAEFEDYKKSWANAKAVPKANNNASGGKIVDNTNQDDIFYFGEYTMDDMLVLNVRAGTQAGTGDASAEVFAVDVTGIDVSSLSKDAVSKLLTSENSIGKTIITPTEKDWNNYLDNNIVLKKSFNGKKGIFVKCGATVKYAGNYDYIEFKYNMGGSASATALQSDDDALTAENDSARISVTGDIVTATSKYDGTVTQISYNKEYNKNVTFTKLTNWNGALTALARDNASGESSLLTSPMGSVWMDATPTYFAEKDAGAPQKPIINDMLPISDQMYLGCSGGWLITMTSCSKCSTLKKVCDFDITSMEYDDGKIILYGAGGEEKEVDVSDVRQQNIQAQAAMELASSGGGKLVDVRSAEEFAKDGLSGAINVPVSEFENWIKTQSKLDTIIVYCSSGMRAARAVSIANSLGYTKIYNLGGM